MARVIYLHSNAVFPALIAFHAASIVIFCGGCACGHGSVHRFLGFWQCALMAGLEPDATRGLQISHPLDSDESGQIRHVARHNEGNEPGRERQARVSINVKCLF